MPIAKGKGVFFNELLELDWDHVSPVNLNLDLCAKVELCRWRRIMRMGNGDRSQALHRLLRLPARVQGRARHPARCFFARVIKPKRANIRRCAIFSCRCCAITARIRPASRPVRPARVSSGKRRDRRHRSRKVCRLPLVHDGLPLYQPLLQRRAGALLPAGRDAYERHARSDINRTWS